MKSVLHFICKIMIMFVVGKGEYLMYKSRPGEDLVRSLVVPVPTKTTAGVYVFSSLYGNVVVGPTMMRQRSKDDRSCDPAVQAELRRHAETLFPALKGRGALNLTDAKLHRVTSTVIFVFSVF